MRERAARIFDAQSGNKEREVAIPDVDEVINPTWAPDGHAVCFTGMRAGLTDLYVFDLNTSRVRRLTNDAFADVQPAWSPDGRRIAFATDRFSSRLDTLDMGAPLPVRELPNRRNGPDDGNGVYRYRTDDPLRDGRA